MALKQGLKTAEIATNDAKRGWNSDSKIPTATWLPPQYTWNDRQWTYVTPTRGPHSPSFGQLRLQNIFFQLTTIVVFRCLSNASPFSTVLENVANLLRVDIYELSDALTQKSMILRGEEILSPLSVEQVCDYVHNNSYLSQEPSTLSPQLLPVRLANISNALS